MAKVMISLPDDLLRDIDTVAKVEHRKRSEFFRGLAVRYLKKLRRSQDFVDLETAATTSMDFWDNEIDDEAWNAP